PENARKVQSFLGLCGYFRKFFPSYSTVARSLSNLLKMDARFQFGAAERNAFERLKVMLSERPVLSLFRVGAKTELHADASMYVFGAKLLQKDSTDQMLHPVYYASKTTPAEEKYSSYELKVLAIVKALKRFHAYLLGIKFKIITDCRAFAQTMTKRDL
ncbi:Retrotransposable element Tf2 155 kDa protein type 3, partial [Camponotus floridanus]